MAPSTDKHSASAKGKKGKKEPGPVEDTDGPPAVVWFNKMTVAVADVQRIFRRLQELTMFVKEERIDEQEVRKQPMWF